MDDSDGAGPIVDDARRVASLERYDVLHRPPGDEFLAIVELAAQVTGTPMAAINLMTDVDQHTVATVGFESSVCRRDDSMCAAVLSEKSPVVVPDARLDPRFVDNPFVTGVLGSVRFYASHRLVDRAGVVIGTLCVFDNEPRILDDQQTRALGVLADRIVDVLELALRSRQLTASNERLSAFASRVSHDLKTPLTSVSMTLQLIEEQLGEIATPGGSSGPGDTGWLIDKALKGTERMAAMIDGLLGYATVDGSFDRTSVDLNTVLGEVLIDLRTELESTQTTCGRLPVVMGDAVQLRTVLQNLLSNAARYRHPDRPLRIEVGSERRDRKWRISVADNGIGIAPEDRERVFQRGVRVNGDRPDRASGSTSAGARSRVTGARSASRPRRAAGRPCGSTCRREPGAALIPGRLGQSRQNSLPSGSVSTMNPWLSGGAGSCRRSRAAPCSTSRSHSASSAAIRASPSSPGAARTSRCRRFLACLPSGTSGRTAAARRRRGRARRRCCCAAPAGPRTRRAPHPRSRSPPAGRRRRSRAPRTRSRPGAWGSAQSKVTWISRDMTSPSCCVESGAGQSRWLLPGRSSIRCRATSASRSVSGSTWIWLTTSPATSDSIAHTKCGRSMRFIVEQ